MVALVLLLHLLLVLFWTMQPEPAAIALQEMSVTIALQPAEVLPPRAQVMQQSEAIEQPKPQPRREAAVKLASATPVQEVAEVEPLRAVASAAEMDMTTPVAAIASNHPSVADSEPDYQARYLHNPRPDYPMVAQRMGWQGKVILNVEVLTDGACGALSVFRSSGHEVLDNAAMNAVKTWHFTPARHAGRAVSLWFKVPINFSLEDNEA